METTLVIDRYTPDEHTRIGELFLAVCDLEPEDQTSHLESTCGQQPQVRAVIEAMLEQDRRVERSLQSQARRNSKRAARNSREPEQPPSVSASPTVVPPSKGLPAIEGYEVHEVLGYGGMGVVYKALQLDLKRDVAIKILPALVGAAAPAVVERFKREAAAAAQLRHNNIVPIYDFGQSDAGYYYSMELVRGASLDVIIRTLREMIGLRSDDKETAPEDSVEGMSVAFPSLNCLGRPFERDYFERVARWMIDVSNALSVADKAGIVHRDIKPGNLILAASGKLMVTDFGLVRAEHDEPMTAANAQMGTLRYMSPEQLLGSRVPIDHRTDIYSLGATMFELLTLRPLFEGRRGEKLMACIVGEEPPGPRTLNPNVPRDLNTVCLKMLDKLPQNR